MNALAPESLAAYWSLSLIEANIVVFFNLLGALLLGLLVGYERSYHGRAAGMRTYGLVCLASCALTVIVGYPELWYGGHHGQNGAPDATRVIQGIVTGIGFLGAGVIIKEGFTISGLTTAASIWTASAIGILVGVGFYAAAILLSIMSALIMMWLSKLESWLPSRHAITLTLYFKPEFKPEREFICALIAQHGYDIAWGSLTIRKHNARLEWLFVAVARNRQVAATLPDISHNLASTPEIDAYQLSFARN